MKKYVIYFLIVILIFVLLLCGCNGRGQSDVYLKSKNPDNKDSSWEEVSNRGVINIGVSLRGESLPMLYKTADNEYSGFLADLAKEISSGIGLKVNFTELDTKDGNDIASKLTSGELDVVLNGYLKSDEGNPDIKWIYSHITTNYIIVCNNNSKINTKSDLSGKKIAVANDTASYILAQSDINIDNNSLVKYNSKMEAINAFLNNGADALVINDAYFNYCTKGKASQFKVLDDIISVNKIKLGVLKTNAGLYDKINEEITKLSDDKTLRKLSKKWFYKDLTD